MASSKADKHLSDILKDTRHTLYIYMCIVAVSLTCLTACDDYDSFTTDRSSTLSFSRDSIVFDTLIATIPSATQVLSVYNHDDKGLRITDVWLEGGNNSRFRINIDGQDLTEAADRHGYDFEVRRRDSLIVRAEVTLPATGNDEAATVTDALHFRLESGIEQKVQLVATSIDAFFLKGAVITTDTTFTARRPIVVYDSLVVAPSATLTLEANTQLLFHQEAGMVIKGCLIANGSIGNPVIFRTDRTDHIFDYLPYDRLPSRWEGLRFTAESMGNMLKGVDIHGGNYGVICDSTGTDELKLTIADSRIHDLGGDGFKETDCQCIVQNSEISNTLGHCVWLIGGKCRFSYCTLAQFYPLSANRGDALHLGNSYETVYHPLVEATFEDCVVTGYAEDVVMGEWIDADKLSNDEQQQIGSVQEEFVFNHCLLATEIPTDSELAARFISCVYDDPEADIHREKNFNLIDAHALLYDFTPVEKSPIRNMANPSTRENYPLDLRGRSRMTDELPDAGCYEYIADAKDEQ